MKLTYFQLLHEPFIWVDAESFALNKSERISDVKHKPSNRQLFIAKQ